MTTPSTSVQILEPTSVARLDPQALIAKAIETGAGIDTLERLVALAKDVREVQAKEAWYSAMAEFQRTCPSIRKTATAKIATRTGPGYTYRYAPLDEILSVIQPVMGPLGLSVSWRSAMEPTHVMVQCRISHTLGHHEESGFLAMPIVQGDGAGATPPQRVGIAATYAKRYSLLGIIGLAPEDDDDAAEGGQSPETEPTAEPDRLVTEPQVKRFYAIARGAGWTENQVHDLLASHRLNSAKEIPVGLYDRIVDQVKQGPTS